MTAVTALPVASQPLRPLPFAASGKDSSFGGTAAQESVGTNLGVRTTDKGRRSKSVQGRGRIGTKC
jgi:hypothetical protein